MSSRAPMWYCYECHAEMRPLMVPDPHCASCNSTFVEEIEGGASPENDPRNFQVAGRNVPEPTFGFGLADYDDDSSEFTAFNPNNIQGARDGGNNTTNGAPGSGASGPMAPDQALHLFHNIMAGIGGPQRRRSTSSLRSPSSTTSRSNTFPGGGNTLGTDGGSGASGSNTIRIDRRTRPDVPDTTPHFIFGSRGPSSSSQSQSPTQTSSPSPNNNADDPAAQFRQLPPLFSFPTSGSSGGGGGGPRVFGGPLSTGNGFYFSASSGGGPGGGTRAGGFGTGPDISPLLATLFGAPGGPGSPHGPGFPGEAPGSPGSGSGGNMLRNIIVGLLGGGHGDVGDYALDNEALDRIVTQLMEQTGGDKPVPAPDDMIEKLPRITIKAGSSILERDCAVCKDTFEVDQQIIELPCKHDFHDECILPWIKQSGTCPVCRYELVPQPKHDRTPPSQRGPEPGSPRGGFPTMFGNPGSGSGFGSGSAAGGGGGSGSGANGGLGSFFSSWRGGNNNSSGGGGGGSTGGTGGNSGGQNRATGPGSGSIPGAWDLD